jgi:DNA repair protein RecO (recombination protein O)
MNAAVSPSVAAGREMMDRAMRIVPARSELRVTNEAGFVLHAHPYRETSLVLDVFTRDHGRVAMVAKGAKRPHSALRAVLQHFHPIALSWTGRGEVKTLTKAEYVGGMLPLAGDALLSGFYLNELLLRFCPREDAHPALFRHYMVTLTRLSHGEPASLYCAASSGCCCRRLVLRWRSISASDRRTGAARARLRLPARAGVRRAHASIHRAGPWCRDRRCWTWRRMTTRARRPFRKAAH